MGDPRPRRAGRVHGSVPAGLNGIQTVERKLKVTTRYGGRYVQSIDGVAGSLGGQRDWFYFVDGVEGDRSAAEVRSTRAMCCGGTSATGRRRR